MTSLPVFIDIDGTMTTKGGSPNGPPRQDLIQKVRELIETVPVVIWSGNGTRYAIAFCEKYNLHPIVAIGKPHYCVDDNPHIRPRDRMRVLSPEEFLKQ